MHVTNYGAVLLQEAAVTGTLFGHTKQPALHVGKFFLDDAQLVMGVGAGRSAERTWRFLPSADHVQLRQSAAGGRCRVRTGLDGRIFITKVPLCRGVVHYLATGCTCAF
jgi:hypothetical protein